MGSHAPACRRNRLLAPCGWHCADPLVVRPADLHPRADVREGRRRVILLAMPPGENIALRVPIADEESRLREYLPIAFLPGGTPSWLIAERASASEWLGAWCLRWTN